ncbi:BrxA family protein [Peijinzhouia sedimentorum]
MTYSKYELSFTAASLQVQEMVNLLKIERGILPEDRSGKISSKRRKGKEYKKRLATLTEEQIEVLLEGNSLVQKQIAFLASCKLYEFLREFVTEVLREKMVLMDYQITDGEYLSFFRRKQQDHPELEEITDLTSDKIKQVTFRILEQAGIINSTKERVLQYQILEPETVRAIKSDNIKWLEIFLLSDEEINNYNF